MSRWGSEAGTHEAFCNRVYSADLWEEMLAVGPNRRSLTQNARMDEEAPSEAREAQEGDTVSPHEPTRVFDSRESCPCDGHSTERPRTCSADQGEAVEDAESALHPGAR